MNAGGDGNGNSGNASGGEAAGSGEAANDRARQSLCHNRPTDQSGVEEGGVQTVTRIQWPVRQNKTAKG